LKFHTLGPDDELHLFGAASDNNILGWNLLSSEPVIKLTGHVSTVTAIVVSPEPGTLISCGRDGIIRVWDLASQSAVRAIAALESLETLVFLSDDPFEKSAYERPYFITGGERGEFFPSF
jgi:WD40 repeat protein